MKEILSYVIENKTLEKIILSKSVNKEILKAKCRLVEIKNKLCLQVETFYSDNKVFQKNIDSNNAVEYLENLFLDNFRQMNVFSTSGNAEIKFSKSGKLLISNSIKRENVKKANFSHNKEKQYVLPIDTPVDFLVELGVQNKSGKVLDKKTSKFRQINRFLELVKDVEKSIITDDELYILDLCCGKSYLSFAIYYYFTKIKNVKVVMDCVDLKSDVTAYCNGIAKKLNYDGLNFIAGDITNFNAKRQPNLTVSLHACDIATDIVLEKGIKLNSKVIMSTPCCHHEVFNQLSKTNNKLDALIEHSILKQKLCDNLTDSLRCKTLEAFGYSVSALELIDPEETPKNVLIRAIKRDKIDSQVSNDAKEEIISICNAFNIKPYLYRKFIENE